MSQDLFPGAPLQPPDVEGAFTTWTEILRTNLNFIDNVGTVISLAINNVGTTYLFYQQPYNQNIVEVVTPGGTAQAVGTASTGNLENSFDSAGTDLLLNRWFSVTMHYLISYDHADVDSISVFNLDTGTIVFTFTEPFGGVTAPKFAAISPSGQYIVIKDPNNNIISVWKGS